MRVTVLTAVSSTWMCRSSVLKRNSSIRFFHAMYNQICTMRLSTLHPSNLHVVNLFVELGGGASGAFLLVDLGRGSESKVSPCLYDFGSTGKRANGAQDWNIEHGSGTS